ncbi:hypothetical protein HDV05_003105 [Chytridiales sp. JEL 0842]|nr:hypothetical protein HDV05_003105 [Chytridiales sp. JEL 0842]
MVDCDQSIIDGQYTYKCANTTCQCLARSTLCGGPGNVLDLTPIVNSALGDFTLTCPTNSTSTCIASFNFLAQLFPKGLDLPFCTFGECALPTDNPGILSFSVANNNLKPGEIAGVALAGVAIALAAMGLAWAAIYQYKAKKRDTPAERKGATVSFENISYTLPNGKVILKDITGVANAGQVLAIFGPSGAGKSTFLDIVAGKTKAGKVGGTVLLDGHMLSREQIRSQVAYVDQDDLLLPTLTVRETLLFSAKLRLAESMSYADKTAKVDEVLQVLGLAHVADTIVGGGGKRGISGGERRRLSIGVELVTSPAVLFLDEATSGLDSYNALSVVRTLADLAHQHGKTIILTIHQPRSDVYTLFDEILLLREGTSMYCGSGKQASAYFKAIGKPCPDGYNIADHLLDLASAKEVLTVPARQVAGRTVDPELGQGDSETSEVTSASSESSSNPVQQEVKDGARVVAERLPANGNDVKDPAFVTDPTPPVAVGFLTQTMALMERAFKNLIRTPSLLLAHTILSVILGLFLGGVYFKSDSSLGGIQNRLGCLLMLLALLGFSGLSAIGSFVTERALFLRERSNGFYRPMPFFLTKVVFDIIPLRIIPALLMGCISYYMIGLSPAAGNFGKFVIVLVLFASQIGMLCLCIAIAITDVGTATLVAAIVILFKMMFAGFLINQSNMPPFLGWIQYLSLFRYSYEALVVNDLTDTQIVDNISGAAVNPTPKMTISSIAWVPKGAAKETPEKFALTEEEYAKIEASISQRLEQSRADLTDAQQQESNGAVAAASKKKGGRKGKIESKPAAAATPADDPDAAIVKEFDLDNYDDDEDEGMDMDSDEDEEIAALKAQEMQDAPLFGTVKGLTYHGSNSEDPYITLDDKVDEEQEIEEMMVAPTDNLILTAKTEDDVSHIEVYLYEEDEDNLFIHHDIMLPSFPLCLEWISEPLGRKAGVESKGSYVAVGTFDPEIEIWDLDVIDPTYPEVILGGGPSTEALGTGKKKKRSKKPSNDYHVDAVMCLASNRSHPTLLASGSADMTVKLWDLTSPSKALRSFNNAHKNKVQACAWNRTETTVLLTGGYDKRACVFDTRMPEHVLSFALTADVEALKWDPFQPERFYVSTEDGLVKAFDARNASGNTTTSSTSTPVFTLHAHDAPVSALDLSSTIPGLLITGSADKTVKVWSCAPSQPVKCLATRDLQIGKVFAANFSTDSGALVAVAGGKGNVVLWNLAGNASVRGAFPEAFGKGGAKKEVVTLEDDGEEDEKDGEAEMMGGDADMMDEDDWEDDQ